ncbi:MAG: TonB-dependent receptor [bacterium]
MKKRYGFLLVIVFVLFSSSSYAQHSSGTLVVEVDPEIQTNSVSATEHPKHFIRLIELSSHSLVEEVRVEPDNVNGNTSGTTKITKTFTIHDVPFGSYEVRYMSGTEMIAKKYIIVNSAVPSFIQLVVPRKIAEDVTVEGVPATELPTVSSYYSNAEITSLPSMGSTKKIEALILNSPGAVPDEDGRMHMRGEDAQMQYVIDGIPVTTNSTRIYSSLVNANIIKSATIQRGALPAEYGIATSAIVAVNTRSGFDAPLFADASASIGSFRTLDRSFAIGGNVDNRVALFGAYSSSETDRYLDPIKSFDPNHTDGYTHNYFAKADFLISDKMDLVLLGSRNLANFGIANGGKVVNDIIQQSHPDQDQRQDLSDYMFGARLNATLTDNSALSIVGYKRHVEAMNTSGGLLQISSKADSIKAVTENEDFFIGSHRIDEATGGQIEYSALTKWFDASNTIRVGLGAESYPLQEFFTFAVTNPMKSDPAFAGGDDRLIPYDLTQGGHPFISEHSKTGNRMSAYAQDHLVFENLILDAGVRFDMFKLLESESGISPRVAAAYKLSNDLWIKGSYNRIIMQAPVENILVSSSSEAAVLVGTEQNNVPLNVKSEKSNVIELGVSYKLNENIDIDLNGYAKLIEDFIVKVELGVSGVIFPVNLKQGRVLGGELEVRLHDWNNFSGKLSLSTCDSRGLKPDDGSSPIAAGLIFGEEGENYNMPFAGEDAFQTEHNQILTATLLLNYAHPSGLYATLGGRFDSGLPFDLADSTGTGLDEAQSKAELKRRGYSDEVINLLSLTSDMPGSPDKSSAPHAVFDLSAGYDFSKTMNIPAKITATVLNVLDTKYLYKFESVFGGTHFGLPRTFQVALQVHI